MIWADDRVVGVPAPRPVGRVCGRGNSQHEALTGVSDRTLRIGGTNVAAHIRCDSRAFVYWVTQQGSWESLGVDVSGDPSALEVIRRLKVF